MRASSRTRSVDHACHACRPWTGWCPLEPEREQPHGQRAPAAASDDEPDHGRERQPQQRGRVAASGSRRGRRRARGRTRRQRPPARRGSAGSDEPGDAGRRRPRSQRRPVAGGRSSPQGPRARPVRCAGAPHQASPAGTDPKTAEPGATSAPASDAAARAAGCCGPRRARPRRPARAPMCSTSPSSQWPLRSTSGSTEQPSPRVSSPVTGRDAVQVDVRARPWHPSARA